MKYLTLLLAVFLCLLISCKKKSSKPSGQNVIRYTVNGHNIEISEKYQQITLSGVTFSESPMNIIVTGVASEPYTSIGIGFTKPIDLSNNILSDSLNGLSCTYNNVGQHMNTNSKLNSVKLLVTNNNTNFISGTFEGKCYANWTNPIPGDSIIITNGYFDISKQ